MKKKMEMFEKIERKHNTTSSNWKSIIQEKYLFSNLRTRDRRIDKEGRFHLGGGSVKRVEQIVWQWK